MSDISAKCDALRAWEAQALEGDRRQQATDYHQFDNVVIKNTLNLKQILFFQALGWLLGITTVLFSPGYALCQIVLRLKHSIPIGWDLLRPSSKWVAATDEDSSVIQISECQL